MRRKMIHRAAAFALAAIMTFTHVPLQDISPSVHGSVFAEEVLDSQNEDNYIASDDLDAAGILLTEEDVSPSREEELADDGVSDEESEEIREDGSEEAVTEGAGDAPPEEDEASQEDGVLEGSAGGDELNGDPTDPMDEETLIESDEATSIESDEAASIESDETASIESDEAVSIESDEAASIESDEAASIESDGGSSNESDPYTDEEDLEQGDLSGSADEPSSEKVSMSGEESSDEDGNIADRNDGQDESAADNDADDDDGTAVDQSNGASDITEDEQESIEENRAGSDGSEEVNAEEGNIKENARDSAESDDDWGGALVISSKMAQGSEEASGSTASSSDKASGSSAQASGKTSGSSAQASGKASDEDESLQGDGEGGEAILSENEGGGDTSLPEEEEEALLLEEADEEEADLQEDPNYAYNYDKQNSTLYITLNSDFNEDIVVLDSLTDTLGDRLKVELDLNGHTLTPIGRKNHTGITVFGQLTIMDTSEEKTGKLDGSGLSNVRGIEVAERGVLRLEGGTICNFTSSGNGAAISVNKGGKLIMAGGSVVGNVSKENGGGIFAYAAHSVSFEEGTVNVVAGNSAKNGGGFAFATTGTKEKTDENENGDGDEEEDESFELRHIAIYANRADVNGGAIYFDEEIEAEAGADALFSGNIAGQNGGAVYFRAASTLTLNGNRMAGNTAENGSGGAIHMAGQGSKLVMNGAVVGVDVTEEEESADKYEGEDDPGSELFFLTDTVEYGAMEEDALPEDLTDTKEILSRAEEQARRGNLSEKSYGGAIYMYRKGALELHDSALSRNMAYNHGGGFYLYSENNAFSSLLIENSRLERNVLEGYENGNRLGAGGYLGQYATVKISDSIFRKNRGASHGSGLYINYYNGGITVSRTNFVKNHFGPSYEPNGANGGGMYVEDSGRGTMLLEDCNFLYNRADLDNAGSGGIRAGSSTKTVLRCKFIGNRTTGGSAGGSFGGITEIEDCLVENNYALHIRRSPSCGGISAGGSKLTVKGNTIIQNNYCNSNGGGLYSSNTELHLEAGTQILSNRSGNHGGGIFASDNTTTYLHEGVLIQGNTSTANYGGGMYTGSLVMDGGLVSGNTSASYGGGIYVNNKAEMSGGEISGNVSNGNAGGLALGMASDSVLSGGKIVNNWAKSSCGGVQAFMHQRKSHLLTIGGNIEISGNKANSVAGGVGLTWNPHCVITENARITDNTAMSNGGGIYLDWPGDNSKEDAIAYPWGLHITGAQVQGNHANSWGNDVYARSLMQWNYPAYIRTNFLLEKTEGGLWFDEKYTEELSENRDNLAENAVYEDPENEDGDQKRREKQKHGVDLANYFTFLPETENRAVINETGTEYPTVQAAIDAAMDGQTVRMLRDSIETVTVPEGRKLALDIAGFALRARKVPNNNSDKSNYRSVITVSNSADFTLKDTSQDGSGTVSDGKGQIVAGTSYITVTYGGGVYVMSNARFTLESGTITNNSADYGGGVFLQDEAEMRMTGGAVRANTGGCGVWVYHDYNIRGDAVKDTAEYYQNSPVTIRDATRLGASFVMSGGEISENSGYGIRIRGASSHVTIEGNAKITGNKSGGGGVYGDYGVTNRANRYGNSYGNIVDDEPSHYYPNLVMTGGEISGNTGYHGVGIYLSTLDAEITGGVIKDNVSDNSSRYGGGIYMTDTKTHLRIAGDAQITGNKSGYGGGICVYGASPVLEMEGGAVYGNHIHSDLRMRGTDIYLSKGQNSAVLLDASGMTLPEGVESYNCWLDEVNGDKYASVSSMNLEELTKDAALCLAAERDPAVLNSARIGNKEFITLQSAINWVLAGKTAGGDDGSGESDGNEEGASDSTIYLLRDLTESVYVKGNRDITIDLNGYDLHCDQGQAFYLDWMYGTVTVKSTVEQEDAHKEDGEKVNSGRILGAGSEMDSESMRAVYIYGGTFVLEEGVTMQGFHSDGSGGAVCVYPAHSNSKVYLDGIFHMMPGSTITDCSSSGSGGAIYAGCYGNYYSVSKVILDGALIEKCHAKSHGGAMYTNFNTTRAFAAGTAPEDKEHFEVRIHGGTIIRNNKCGSTGGGVTIDCWNNAANTLEDHQEIIEIYDVQIVDNESTNGSVGGLYVGNGFPEIGKADVERERTLISRNKAMYDVGGLDITSNNTSRDRSFVRNVTITDNSADHSYGGAYIVTPAVIEGCLVENNRASMVDGSVGGIYVSTPASDDSSYATVMRNTDIINNRARYHGGLYLGVVANGSLFENLKIVNNYALERGGGVGMGEHSGHTAGTTITFKDCTIKGNEGGAGGMWMNWWKATLDIRNCEITENRARNNKDTGGISAGYSWTPTMEQYGTLVLSGTTDIHHNTGRGISNSNHTIIYGTEQDNAEEGLVNQVRIRNNYCTGYGAGLYQSGGWAELLGGSIHDNESTDVGGGVYFYYDWSHANIATVREMNVLDGTKIYGNKGSSGGGIFINSRSKLLMKSGEIRDNTASGNGGGVYLASNTSSTDSRVKDSDGKLVVIGDTLFEFTGGRIFDNNATYGKDVFGKYNGTYRNSELRLIKASDMFLDNSAESVERRGISWIDERIDRIIDDNIQGVLAYDLPLTLNYQTVKPSAAVKRENSDSYIIYNSVQDAIGAILDGTHGVFADGQKPEIVLVDDVSENVQIPGAADVVLNLNGFTLRGNGSSAISCYGDVRIVDEKKTVSDGNSSYEGKADSAGTITGTSGQSGGGVRVLNGGNATLASGQIANCRAGAQRSEITYGGSGVSVEAGTFTLEGGAIRQNTVYYNGAAVLVKNGSGKFTMTGGVVEENTSTSGSGIIYNYGGSVLITGGVIRNNKAASVGTIVNSGSGTLNIGGEKGEGRVQIVNNTVVNKGGAIYQENGTIFLSNVLMQGNTVTCARQTSVNAVNGSGGAIYQAGGTLYINEGTEIRGNKASRGGGIYQNSGSAYMMGGIIEDNTAELGGGIAQYPLNTMTFVASKGKVAGNHTTLYGSGNDIYSWYEGKDNKFDHPELVKNKPEFTITPAAEMEDEAYNAWKDDTYKGTIRTAPVISNAQDANAGGQYVTGSILTSANLQLTAAYYDTEVEKEFDSDVYIQDFKFQVKEGDKGNGIADGTVDDNKTDAATLEVRASEITAKDMEGAELVQDGEHAGMYLYEGTYYEPDQMVKWTPGSDGSTTNLLVRSFDTLSYSFLVSLVAQKGAESGKNRVVHPWIEITLPCDATEAEFDMSSVGKIFKGAPSFSIRQEDGKTVQVLSGYWEQEMKDAENAYRSFSIKIHAMMNGDTFKPHFRAWIDGNEENATTIPSAPAGTGTGEGSGSQASGTETAGGSQAVGAGGTAPLPEGGEKENNTPPAVDDGGQESVPMTELDSPTITISAAPKYNTAIKYNSQLAYAGYFNLETGEEVSEEDYKKAKSEANYNGNIVHGMMVGYGLMVSLYNETDGLRGIELPDKNLEFDVSFKGKLFYDGSPLFAEGSPYADLAERKPIFWAYKENMNTPMGKQLNEVSLYNRNMDWNDEDDVVKSTRFAYDAAPFNSGGGENACYSGGSWLVTDGPATANPKEMTVHVSVSNYVLNGDSRPNQTANGVSDSRFNTPQVKPFTAGYVQILFPYDEKDIKDAYRKEYGRYIAGYVSVGMQAAISKFDARGKSGRIALTKKDEDGLETLNTYYERESALSLLEGTEEDPTAVAKCEQRFGDNYSFNDFAQYLYDGEDGTPSDSISKTTYFLNASRQTLTGSEGKGSTPINSQVYAGGTVTFGSVKIPTDDLTKPQYYIDSKDFNTNTDNLVEYNYMTALNILQKFDAEVFHPAYMDAYVDKEFTSNAQVNNGFTGKNRDKKTNVQPFQIVTSEAQAEWDTVTYNKPMNYRLTILYAAKPDKEDGTPGGNWVKIYDPVNEMDDGGAADMDKYHEENLLYFRTLQELEDSGRICVAVLFEFRDMAIRTGRNVSANTYLDVTEDFTKTGNTYITTNEARAWKTYRRFYKETWRKPGNRAENMREILYNYSYIKDTDYEPLPIDTVDETTKRRVRYGEDESSEGAGDSLAERSSWTRKIYTRSESDDSESGTVYTGTDNTFTGYTRFINDCLDYDHYRYKNEYKKTQYKNGVRQAGGHNGWLRGNVLLLYTLDTSIVIGNTDYPVGSNTPQTSYNVSKGERIVNYRISPEVKISSGATSEDLVRNGSQSVRVVIELEIPKGLTYRKGSINFEYGGSGYTAEQMQWDVDLSEETDENGGRMLTLSTFVTDIDKKLPNIIFACDIGNMRKESEDVTQGQALTVLSRIYAEYQEINRLAAEAHSSSEVIIINKDGNNGIKKDVEEVLVEVGEDIVYTMQYMNGSTTTANIRFGDVLPYNGDKRGTEFTGAYRVREMDVTFSDKPSFYHYLGWEVPGEDNGTEGTEGTEGTPGTEGTEAAPGTNGADGENGNQNGGTSPVEGESGDTAKAVVIDSETPGKLFYKAAQTVPQTEDAQVAFIKGIGSATKILPNESDNVSVTAYEAGDEEHGIEPYTIRYVLDSDSMILQKAGNGNGNAVYGFFPNLSGVSGEDGEKQGVSLRVVMTAVSKELSSDGKRSFLTNSGSSQTGDNIQTGGKKYVNNFIFSGGGLEEEIISALRSSSVSVATVARSISGYVWLDKDKDDKYVSRGSRDSLMKNVNVNLYKLGEDGKSYSLARDVLGNELPTVRTDDDGRYSFRNLGPGWYKVQISNPSNDYVSKKDEKTKTPRPLPFDQLTLTDITNKMYGSMSDGGFERDNSNYGIFAARTEEEGEVKYEFSPEDWATLAKKLKTEKYYSYEEDKLPDAGSMLIARTHPIRMPEKKDMGGGIFSSTNWNFGLFYTCPVLQKKWVNMVFEPAIGTELDLTLRGYIDYLQPEGDGAGTEGNPNETTEGGGQNNNEAGNASDGSAAQVENPDGSGKDGIIRAESLLETEYAKTNYENVYENIFSMKAELDKNGQRSCTFSATRGGLNDEKSGNFTEDAYVPGKVWDDGTVTRLLPCYTWTMEAIHGGSGVVFPLPVKLYRDHKEYEVKYTLSEALFRGTTDRESTYWGTVRDPWYREYKVIRTEDGREVEKWIKDEETLKEEEEKGISQEKEEEDEEVVRVYARHDVLYLKAENTRPLSGFDFVKVDSVTEKPIIEIIERDPETGERTNRDLQDVTFRLYRSRTRADVIDPTLPGVEADDPAFSDKLSEADLIYMVRPKPEKDEGDKPEEIDYDNDAPYRPRRFGDPTSDTDKMEVTADMTITKGTGKLAISELPAGAYWLMETKAQDGYALPGGYWKILIYANPEKADGDGDKLDTLIIRGSVKSQTEALELVEDSLKETKVVEGSSGINQMTFDGTSFKLPNKPGLLMARTGGSGTKGFVFFGLLAVMAGAAGWWLDRRKRRAAA